jgi:hypothetical protein
MTKVAAAAERAMAHERDDRAALEFTEGAAQALLTEHAVELLVELDDVAEDARERALSALTAALDALVAWHEAASRQSSFVTSCGRDDVRALRPADADIKEVSRAIQRQVQNLPMRARLAGRPEVAA